MNPFVTILLSFSLILAGYWLAGPMRSISPAGRLAVAALAGLASLLLCLSVVNFFAPISGWRAWLCLSPAGLTLFRPSQLAALRSDTAAVFLTRRAFFPAALVVASLALLVWPEFTQKGLVYYDGTNNHDGYFWIAGARHLQSYSYMEIVALSHERPWDSFCTVLAGWRPGWGRAGSEGFLAFAAALVSSDPVEIYLPATAALLLPWIAVVYLVVRTFWIGRLTKPGLAALIGLQPIFLFFRANGNLPNLLGVLTGAGAVIATARCLDARPGRLPWLALLALSVHGCLYAYPEIFPFVALPCALLVARAALQTARAVPAVLLAALAGLAVNPATSIRACSGFIGSFALARADRHWVDTFASLGAPQYLPALATASVPMAGYLGAGVCLAGSLALVAALVLAFRDANDRFGAAASLSGGAALALYTTASHFSYGWLKTDLFSGVFISAVLPIAGIDACWRSAILGRRLALRMLAFAVALILAGGIAFHEMNLQKWSRRKGLTRDWFALRSVAAEELPGAKVVIDPATFPMAFFDGMWGAYFLSDNDLSFAARGTMNGGYLKDWVLTEDDPLVAGTRACLVGPEWAGTFDANSDRLFSSTEAVLLRSANRVTRLQGFLPANGVPTTAGGHLAIDLVPHSPSELQFSLAPADGERDVGVSWQVLRRAQGASAFRCDIAGPPPWRITVPLESGRINRIDVEANAAGPGAAQRFAVSGISVASR